MWWVIEIHAKDMKNISYTLQTVKILTADDVAT